MQSQGVVSMEPRVSGQVVNTQRTNKLNESSKKQMSQTMSTTSGGRRVATARNNSNIMSTGRNEGQNITITTQGTDAKKFNTLLHRREGE